MPPTASNTQAISGQGDTALADLPCKNQNFYYDGIMESKDAAPILAALAQDTRLDLLRLLLAEGPNGLPAGAIASRLGIAASTLSFHLSALERAGLTQSTRRGRHIIHAARFIALRNLVVFLTEAYCANRPVLRSDIARLLEEPEPTDPGMTPSFNVLFLCTHNAARSIMAEVILRQVGGSRFNVWSAGSEPASAPSPAVLAKLQALGHDVSGLHSKSWHMFAGPSAPRMDFVITLCDTLTGQQCPDFGDMPVTAAWPLPDPMKFHGSPAEEATMLNELYASLRRRLEIFVSLPFASLDRMAMKQRLDQIGGAPVPARGG
jgi:protein-tyrosine-phosphatase/DNA-binding transcriptional ArsR family regulator